MLLPTQRFSNRVENYVPYRPSYPREVIELLRAECNLTLESVVADIGSGTGKLTELILPHAKCVVAVEPNVEMREAGERLLETHSNFFSLAATAEATTLAGHRGGAGVSLVRSRTRQNRVRAHPETRRTNRPDLECSPNQFHSVSGRIRGVVARVRARV